MDEGRVEIRHEFTPDRLFHKLGALAPRRSASLATFAFSRSTGRGPHGVGMEFPRVAGQLFGVHETDALVCRGCGHRAPRRRPGDEAARPRGLAQMETRRLQ